VIPVVLGIHLVVEGRSQTEEDMLQVEKGNHPVKEVDILLFVLVEDMILVVVEDIHWMEEDNCPAEVVGILLLEVDIHCLEVDILDQKGGSLPVEILHLVVDKVQAVGDK